ncbi:MAG: flavin reductase family protein [Chloroflexota bacterium]
MKTIYPSDIERKENYKLLTGSIVPRAIAWVSSQDADGNLNLAPFSYFTAVSANPPMVIFCTSLRSSDNGRKDTYHNVQATGEFVINFVSEDLADAMNITAQEVAPQIDEFERAGVTPLASEKIRVPRVQESPIHFECKLHQIVEAGDGHIVIGEVLAMHFADTVYQEGNYINTEALKPIGRLAGPNYAHITDFFQLKRPPSEIEGKE